MASAAQIVANRANAQLSTGPTSDPGKASVAQNRVTHGLSSRGFFLLPGEDPAQYQALLTAFGAEYQADGPTAAFLVTELAQSEWRLRRISAIEGSLLSGDVSSLIDLFRSDSAEQALAKLGRYETRIRRDWYRALAELRALRRDDSRAVNAEARYQQAEANARFTSLLEEVDHRATYQPRQPAEPPCESKPMPAHLERELAAHRRRDPLFDPAMDASQMSKELRRWFESTRGTGTAVAAPLPRA